MQAEGDDPRADHHHDERGPGGFGSGPKRESQCHDRNAQDHLPEVHVWSGPYVDGIWGIRRSCLVGYGNRLGGGLGGLKCSDFEEI